MNQEIPNTQLHLLPDSAQKLGQNLKKSNKKLPNPVNISLLFAKFGAIYGEKWTSRITDETSAKLAIQVWQRGLHRLTDEQINNAVDKCSDIFEWPPSIAEFRRLAFAIPSCIELYNKLKNSEPDARLDQTMRYITDTYNFKMLTAGDHYRQFKEAYNAMLNENLSKV